MTIQQEAPMCPHCGRYAPSHQELCVDHPANRRRVPYMSPRELAGLLRHQ